MAIWLFRGSTAWPSGCLGVPMHGHLAVQGYSAWPSVECPGLVGYASSQNGVKHSTNHFCSIQDHQLPDGQH